MSELLHTVTDYVGDSGNRVAVYGIEHGGALPAALLSDALSKLGYESKLLFISELEGRRFRVEPLPQEYANTPIIVVDERVSSGQTIKQILAENPGFKYDLFLPFAYRKTEEYHYTHALKDLSRLYLHRIGRLDIEKLKKTLG